jgi:hypothetical protein
MINFFKDYTEYLKNYVSTIQNMHFLYWHNYHLLNHHQNIAKYTKRAD